MIDLPRAVEDIDRLGQPFRVTWQDRHYPEEAAPEPGERWFQAGRLADSTEIRQMIELHALNRRMPVARHAASLAFQRYCHRICGVGAAAWLRHGVVLNLDASNTSVRFASGTPDFVSLHALEVRACADAETLVRTVVDGHLLPVASAIKAETGPGMGNLWGNIAAGFAGAFQKLSRSHDAVAARDHAAAVLATRPQLARSGDLRVLEGPKGARLHYDRKTCCHWYVAPDGKYCSWCSRISKEERTLRFEQMMAEET